jgi:hypothetical protein
MSFVYRQKTLIAISAAALLVSVILAFPAFRATFARHLPWKTTQAVRTIHSETRGNMTKTPVYFLSHGGVSGPLFPWLS